jgi:hypothetical protein
MFRDTLIAHLQKNRLMSTDAEVEAFDSAMIELGTLPLRDVKDALPEVFLAFDDSTEHSEVLWGLIHYTEAFSKAFDIDTELRALAIALPTLIVYAPNWVALLLLRWINHEDSRSRFREILRRLPMPGQTIIRQVLEKMAKEREDHRAKVEAAIGT